MGIDIDDDSNDKDSNSGSDKDENEKELHKCMKCYERLPVIPVKSIRIKAIVNSRLDQNTLREVEKLDTKSNKDQLALRI